MDALAASAPALTHGQLRSMYRTILLPRLVEEKMLILLRQGKLSKWFSGIGQEAIAAGVVCALDADDYILPMHLHSLQQLNEQVGAFFDEALFQLALGYERAAVLPKR